jgi:hypothetical protein
MTHRSLVVLVLGATALAACDATQDDLPSSYVASTLTVESGAQTVDLLDTGGLLSVDFGAPEGRPQAYGTFLVPSVLIGGGGVDASIFYVGTYERRDGRVTFDVRPVQVHAFVDGRPVDGPQPISDVEARGLIATFVEDPVWRVGTRTLEAEPGAVQARLEEQVGGFD